MMRWVHTVIQLAGVIALAWGVYLLTGHLGWVFTLVGCGVFLLSVLAEGLSPERIAQGQREYAAHKAITDELRIAARARARSVS